LGIIVGALLDLLQKSALIPPTPLKKGGFKEFCKKSIKGKIFLGVKAYPVSKFHGNFTKSEQKLDNSP
jgi:hypothetical protein